jgi:DoxX-like family
MKVIGYWTTTAVVAGVLLFGGVMALLHGPEVLVGQFFIQTMHHLGYPLYLLTILGCWKLLGAIALLVPRFPRRKRMGICWHLLRYDRCSSIVCSEWRERGYSPPPRCSHARFVGASPAKPDPGSPVLGMVWVCTKCEIKPGFGAVPDHPQKVADRSWACPAYTIYNSRKRIPDRERFLQASPWSNPMFRADFLCFT